MVRQVLEMDSENVIFTHRGEFLGRVYTSPVMIDAAELSTYLQGALEFSNGILDMLGGTSSKGVLVIQIHSTLDDVGTCGNDGMSAVVGYVAYSEAWKKFNGRWLFTLAQLHRDYLHTAKYLSEFPLVGGRGMTDDDICLILAPFIEAVKGALLAEGGIPVCVITDCDAYDQLSANEKKFIRPPEENSFEWAIKLSCEALEHKFNLSDAVSIQMDESANAPRLYSCYEAMKRESEFMKQHLGALCFCDDRRHPPVQAADMLGNVLLKSWRKAASGGELPRAFRELTFSDGAPKTKMLHFNVRNLRALAQRRMQIKDRMAL